MYGIYSVPCELLPPATNFRLSVMLRTRLHLQPSTSDNTDTFQNFLKNCLGLLATLCQTHVTAIPACNGTHKKFFDNADIYEAFYQILYELMQISIKAAGFHLQNLLVYWLRNKGETRAAEWFERYWTGEEKGRYLLGCCGVGLISNNQSLESQWRWDRVAISNSAQVTIGGINFPTGGYKFPHRGV